MLKTNREARTFILEISSYIIRFEIIFKYSMQCSLVFCLLFIRLSIEIHYEPKQNLFLKLHDPVYSTCVRINIRIP